MNYSTIKDKWLYPSLCDENLWTVSSESEGAPKDSDRQGGFAVCPCMTLYDPHEAMEALCETMAVGSHFG